MDSPYDAMKYSHQNDDLNRIRSTSNKLANQPHSEVNQWYKSAPQDYNNSYNASDTDTRPFSAVFDSKQGPSAQFRSPNYIGEQAHIMAPSTTTLPANDPRDMSPHMVGLHPSISPHGAPTRLTKSPKFDDREIQSKIVSTSVLAGLNELFGDLPVAPLPPNSSSKTAPGFVYEVTFKRLSGDYILHARVTTPISLGDLVVVSAERGCEDLGCVTRIRSVREFMGERLLSEVSPEGKPFNINKHTSKIVRLATTREQRMLGMKGVDEEDVRRYCQHIAINTFALPITITDVDFQFDRRKVTVYYSTAQAQQRVDFRDLVAHLSDVYKTRVWMVGS